MMENNQLEEMFVITVSVDKPVLVGQDGINGRRQLIPIKEGSIAGKDPAGMEISGAVLPGGVDSQVIRPDGICELSARYGVRLNDGRSFYIENNGIRTVPEKYVEKVLEGRFIDPSLYYFCTKPEFEIYDESLGWLNRYIFVCKAVRYPDRVDLKYYRVV